MVKHGKTMRSIVWTTHHVKHVEDQKEVMECFVNRLQMFYKCFFIFVECFVNIILSVNLSNLCGENDKWQNISNETKKCNQHLKDKRCVCLKIKVHICQVTWEFVSNSKNYIFIQNLNLLKVKSLLAWISTRHSLEIFCKCKVDSSP